MQRLVIIDNYDSFTYNLVHLVSPFVDQLDVIRNDEINHSLIAEAHHLILSPGPGLPSDSNELLNVIAKYHQSHNILGVCLGHQAIGNYFGSKLKNLSSVRHGLSSEIKIKNNDILYRNLSNSFQIGHYHSWVIDQLPKEFILTATDNDEEIMSMRHQSLKIFGLQFHPESILTQNGHMLIKNWLDNS